MKKELVYSIVEAVKYLRCVGNKEVSKILEKNGQQSYTSIELLTRTLMNKKKENLINIENQILHLVCSIN